MALEAPASGSGSARTAAPDATAVMSAEQSRSLADFARTCKAAARAVSLYPGTHPAIAVALNRLTDAARRLIPEADLTLTVHPTQLTIDGRAPARPDAAIPELAELLHARLVGALRVERDADAEDWRALLLILARTPDESIATGGLARAWAATGRGRFDISEIDYAEVLRERAGAEGAAWDRIVAYCLRGDGAALDDGSLTLLLDSIGDTSRFEALFARVEAGAEPGSASLGARAAALVRLLRAATEATQSRGAAEVERLLQTAADACGSLTPEMLLALLDQRTAGAADAGGVLGGVLDRISDGTIARFVAGSVATERGATARLAQAFEALVPELERKERLLDVARDEASRTKFGDEERFDELWQNAAGMLLSYSDEPFVSSEYARELSDARTQAIDVERVSDDPPARVQAWLETVSDDAIRDLDVSLLVDLLRIEGNPAQWEQLAAIVVAEIERCTLLGRVIDVQRLAATLVRDASADGRPLLQPPAGAALDRLASGALVRHLVLHLRQAEDVDVPPLGAIASTIGPRLVRPLAEALASEENNRAIRRLREILLGFGAAGRDSVEQLRNSPNPAVRRTAIDLLRVFGGDEALAELTSMLDDADPHVQRESIRAIVQIGTTDAYAVLERALVGGGASRDAMVQQLIGLRDSKAVPLLCHVLGHTAPRGRLAHVHADIIDALGGLDAHPQSAPTLKDVMYRGEWWAPFRTASLRRAAAAALRRIGSPEAMIALQEAAGHRARGVRNAARSALNSAAGGRS